MKKQKIAIKIGKAKVFRNGNRKKNKTPEIFLSLRVFLPSFFTTTHRWQPFPSEPMYLVPSVPKRKENNQRKNNQKFKKITFVETLINAGFLWGRFLIP